MQLQLSLLKNLMVKINPIALNFDFYQMQQKNYQQYLVNDRILFLLTFVKLKGYYSTI